MLRSICALMIGGVVTGFAFLLVTGRYINEGPILLSLSSAHGLHAGDLFVLAGWAAAMLALACLVVLSTGRPRAD
ncbi:hypothetical protein [Blastococcus saxobsidens]|uniref:Uncharacterized protein n=1 Tax=Blastococcus saxobsidens (strain DD2) TaxID=1146883 RepID=H6RN12_BLASD|nr:hypothetical protein [Blastococcus saxobsidens]CCG01365.1 conserved exported protein of unknown function [Blastococcus saxobsidens DD2]